MYFPSYIIIWGKKDRPKMFHKNRRKRKVGKCTKKLTEIKWTGKRNVKINVNKKKNWI